MGKPIRILTPVLVLALAPACSGSGDEGSRFTTDDESEAGSVGSGVDTGPEKLDLGGGSGGTGNATSDNSNPCDGKLQGTVRDFQVSHPDMEDIQDGSDKNIVTMDLGADNKPVYNGMPTTPTTTNADNFNQWFNDVEGVNINLPLTLQLTDQGDEWYFDSAAFFPIDNEGWGNEGNAYNYHFTLEIHTEFTYEGGEVFTFRGDDDVWVYVNKKRVIDLGGIHLPELGSVDMDAMASELGIAIGGTYQLDLFFAERHKDMSNFRIETTIGCLTVPVD
jgi:fibro-slime domain-containing protein